MVVLIASHACDAIEGVFINDDWVPLERNNGAEDWVGADAWIPPENSKYRPSGMSPFVWCYFHLGPEITGDSWFEEKSGGVWSATRHVGRGLCWARVTFRYRSDVYNAGIPRVAFLVRGKQLYDPRTGSVAYSDNPALVLGDYLRSPLGYGSTLTDIDLDLWRAAADTCDELLTVGSWTVPRYSCSGVITADMSRREACEAICDAMAGTLVDIGGEWRIYAGEPAPVVATIGKDDLAGPYEVTPTRSRKDLYNRLVGTFLDVGQNWAKNATPVIRKPEWLAQDIGVELPLDIELALVDRQDQAQRLLWIEGKQNRLQTVFASRLTWAAGLLLQPMDVVELDLPELWPVPKTFRIVEWIDNGLEGVDFVAVEYDDAVWADEPYIDPPASADPGLWVLAIDDVVTITGDEEASVDLVANDLPDPSRLKVSQLGSDDNLVVTLQPDQRTVKVSRIGTYVGTTSVSYTVDDGVRQSTGRLRVTVEDDGGGGRDGGAYVYAHKPPVSLLPASDSDIVVWEVPATGGTCPYQGDPGQVLLIVGPDGRSRARSPPKTSSHEGCSSRLRAAGEGALSKALIGGCMTLRLYRTVIALRS
ncbi:phage tail protein [Benzoatithermus flavus]|uniref:Phage tail protein n=1 Tax=Benzoatithermus flavus TaxID=3108223 RepID=A0ABU8XR59_9PROT